MPERALSTSFIFLTIVFAYLCALPVNRVTDICSIWEVKSNFSFWRVSRVVLYFSAVKTWVPLGRFLTSISWSLNPVIIMFLRFDAIGFSLLFELDQIARQFSSACSALLQLFLLLLVLRLFVLFDVWFNLLDQLVVLFDVVLRV